MSLVAVFAISQSCFVKWRAGECFRKCRSKPKDGYTTTQSKNQELRVVKGFMDFYLIDLLRYFYDPQEDQIKHYFIVAICIVIGFLLL
ncbi:MAG: hypothetical protein PVI97_06370 [Candidatus Thiodiazotropha sp.]|jgi:hypothetical protein